MEGDRQRVSEQEAVVYGEARVRGIAERQPDSRVLYTGVSGLGEYDRDHKGEAVYLYPPVPPRTGSHIIRALRRSLREGGCVAARLGTAGVAGGDRVWQRHVAGVYGAFAEPEHEYEPDLLFYRDGRGAGFTTASGGNGGSGGAFPDCGGGAGITEKERDQTGAYGRSAVALCGGEPFVVVHLVLIFTDGRHMKSFLARAIPGKGIFQNKTSSGSALPPATIIRTCEKLRRADRYEPSPERSFMSYRFIKRKKMPDRMNPA